MLDLDTRVDLDEVVPAHLVNKELSGTGIPVVHTLCQLDGVREDCFPDLLRKVSSRSDFDDFPMTPLDGTVALEEMNDVAVSVGEDLDFDVARAFKETFYEDGTVSKGGFSFGYGALE